MPDDARPTPTGPRHRMPSRGGSHVAYARGCDLVVEWYDFGDGALYEFIKLMVFDAPAQELMAAGLEVAAGCTPDALAIQVAAKFGSFFEVEEFAEKRAIPFALERIIDP